LKNALKYWKRKKKRIFFAHLSFGPAQLAARQRAASACPPARGPLPFFPPRPAWAKPSQPPARPPSFPSPSLTPWPHVSGAPSSFPHRCRIPLSKITDDRIRLLISPFLTRSAFGLYKQGCRAQPPPSNPFASSAVLLRRHHELEALPRHHRPPYRAHRCLHPSHAIDFTLGEFALMCSTRWCFSFTRSCSVVRDSHLRPWCHRRNRRWVTISAGAPPSCSPIRSGSSILNLTAETHRYWFGWHFC
jgi:hypothetical protein